MVWNAGSHSLMEDRFGWQSQIILGPTSGWITLEKLKAPSLRVKSLSFSVLPSWILHGNACLQPRLPFWGAQQEPSIPTPPPLPRGLQIQLACEVALGWALGKAWTQSMPA